MTAKIKNSNGFANLEMYAISNGNQFKYSVKEENAEWQTIQITNIAIKAGKVEIGFLANATANASCQVDDVSLVKNQSK